MIVIINQECSKKNNENFSIVIPPTPTTLPRPRKIRHISQIVENKIGDIAMDFYGGLYAVCATASTTLSGSIYISEDTYTWFKSNFIINNITTQSLTSSTTTFGRYKSELSCISCDNNNLVACELHGRIYISIDRGKTFRLLSNSFKNSWCVVAIRNKNIVAASNKNYSHIEKNKDLNNNLSDGFIYYSTDLGLNWSKSNSPSANWTDIKISADGKNIFACAQNNYIYKSTDNGKTWIPIGTSGTIGYKLAEWRSLVTNFFGNIIVASDKYGVHLYNFSDRQPQWRTIYKGYSYAVASDEDIKNITICGGSLSAGPFSNGSYREHGLYQSVDITLAKTFRTFAFINKGVIPSFTTDSKMLSNYQGNLIIGRFNNKVYIINKLIND